MTEFWIGFYAGSIASIIACGAIGLCLIVRYHRQSIAALSAILAVPSMPTRDTETIPNPNGQAKDL